MVRPLFLGLTITELHSRSRGIRGPDGHLDMVRPMSMTVSTGRSQWEPHSTNIFTPALAV